MDHKKPALSEDLCAGAVRNDEQSSRPPARSRARSRALRAAQVVTLGLAIANGGCFAHHGDERASTREGPTETLAVDASDNDAATRPLDATTPLDAASSRDGAGPAPDAAFAQDAFAADAGSILDASVEDTATADGGGLCFRDDPGWVECCDANNWPLRFHPAHGVGVLRVGALPPAR